MSNSTNNLDICSARTWCEQTGEHDEHTGMGRVISATADRDIFQSDLANGTVQVPAVAAYLFENGAESPTFEGPCIALSVRLPRGEQTATEVTPFEAELLRDHISALLKELGR